MSISNVNDNSKTTKTFNSHGNKNKKVTSTHIKSVGTKHSKDQDEDEDEDDWLSKRNNLIPGSMTTTTVQFEQDEQEEKKVVLGPRNLVSIQIITQNTNGQNIDNGRIFTVKQQPPSRQQQHHKKKKSPSKTVPRRHSKIIKTMHKKSHKKNK